MVHFGWFSLAYQFAKDKGTHAWFRRVEKCEDLGFGVGCRIEYLELKGSGPDYFGHG